MAPTISPDRRSAYRGDHPNHSLTVRHINSAGVRCAIVVCSAPAPPEMSQL
jgi:hypothetical protein